MPIIASLILLAGAERVATLGTPNTDYTTPRAFPDVVDCLRHMDNLGRPRMSWRDRMAWFEAADRGPAHPMLVSEQGEQTRVRLWFNTDLLGSMSLCAPIPVVPFAPGQEPPGQ